MLREGGREEKEGGERNRPSTTTYTRRVYMEED
jgi:hypothetical protein